VLRFEYFMKTLRALAGLFVVVAVFYVAFKLIPPYFNEYQFEDAISQEARYSAYNQQKSDQDIRDSVAKKAIELDIPLTSDQIKVQRNGSEISISADYQVHVDLPGYPLDLKFHPNTKSKRL
jgi:hypothetical protein